MDMCTTPGFALWQTSYGTCRQLGSPSSVITTSTPFSILSSTAKPSGFAQSSSSDRLFRFDT